MYEQLETAIKKFMDTGDSLTSIGKLYNINRQTLASEIKKKYNIEPKDYSKKKKQELYENIYLEYSNSEISMKQICKDKHICFKCFSEYIQERDIRSQENIIQKSKYQVDINIFEKIDSEEKAYWLGFLYADGYNNGKYIQITITENDFNFLKKYRNFMKSTHVIHHRKIDNTVNLTISDKNICNCLSVLGCVKGKTYCCDFPGVTSLPRVYLRDFIRGYFDGDGTMNKLFIQEITSANSIKRKIDKVSFTIKSKTFSKKLIENIKVMCGINASLYYYEPLDRCEVYIQGQDNVRKFLDCMYKEATVFLDRKYAQYLYYILPSDLEIDQIISAKLSGELLPNLYESENEIDEIIKIKKEQSEPKVFCKEINYGNIIDNSDIDQGQRIEGDSLF